MIADVISGFDNRQLAILAWILVGFVLALTRREVRRSVRGLIRAACEPKIAAPLVLMILYVSGVVIGLWLMGIWTPTLVSGTLFWFVGTTLALFVAYDRVTRDPHFFRRTLRRVVSLTVLVGFITSLYPLNFFAELVLVPLLALLGAMLALSTARRELAPVKGCLDALIALVGFALLAYAFARVASDPSAIATIDTGRGFVTPAVLTACFLPFVYGIAVYGTYDSILHRLRWFLDDSGDLYRYACRKILLTGGVRLRAVLRCERVPWFLMLSKPSTRAEIDRIIAHIKSRRPNSLAVPPSLDARMTRLYHERPDGWEYSLFAARLEAGAMTALPADATSRGNDRAFQPPLRLNKVLRTLERDNQDAVSAIRGLDTVFDEHAVESAFGAPGAPGDGVRIVELAERLILVYDRMLEWSARAHATTATDDARELVQTHARLLDRPIKQIEDYIDRWITFALDLPRLLAEADGAPQPVEVDMSLKLTIDDTVLDTFNAELARMRSARLRQGKSAPPAA
jgi:hypothetical protein